MKTVYIEDNDIEKPICKHVINENLMRVQLGQELTKPLSQLNRNCEFKKKYEELTKIKYHDCKYCNKKITGKKRYCSDKCLNNYYQTEEYKAKHRAYYLKHKEEYAARSKKYRGIK